MTVTDWQRKNAQEVFFKCPKCGEQLIMADEEIDNSGLVDNGLEHSCGFLGKLTLEGFSR